MTAIEKIRNIMTWLRWHTPIITTRWRMREYAEKVSKDILELDSTLDKIALNPVIHSLQELRKNTWDLERVDYIINKIKRHFWKPER